MSAAHTPGPWEVIDNTVAGPKIDDKPIWLRPVILRSETGIGEANARLIAAAPDLLEALELLLKDVGTANSMPGAVLARAAIKKATGAAS